MAKPPKPSTSAKRLSGAPPVESNTRSPSSAISSSIFGLQPSQKKRRVGSSVSTSVGGANGSSRRAARMLMLPEDEVLRNANTAFYTQLIADYNTIVSNDTFSDILEAKPRKIQKSGGASSGHMAVFNPEEYRVAMEERGHYKAAFNLFGVDMLWSPVPNVPIRKSAVDMLMNTYFKEPTIFPSEVVVIMTDVSKDPETMLGALRAVSPEEIRAACLKRIAQRIRESADIDELEAWKTLVLSVTFHFKMAMGSQEEQMFESMQLREHLIVDSAAMARTARQWCHLVHAVYTSKSGKLNPQQLANHINENVKLADASDPISETWVDGCLKIYKEILCNQEQVALIEASEDQYGTESPFNSVSKLHAIAKLTKNKKSTAWILASINDLCYSEVYLPANFTHRSLKGEGNNKGFVEVMLFKLELLNYILSNFIDIIKSKPCREKMRDAFASHASYRAHVGFVSGGETSDMSWQSMWKPSAQQTFRLIEDLVFRKEYDVQMRSCLRAKKSVVDTMDADFIKEVVEQIEESIDLESREEEQAGSRRSIMQSDDEDSADETQGPGDPAVAEWAANVPDLANPGTGSWNAEQVEQLKKFQTECSRKVQELKFETEPNNARAVQDAIKATPDNEYEAHRTDSEPGWNIVIYDVPTSGESVTSPKTRKPPLRNQHYDKMMRSSVDAFCSKAEAGTVELNGNVVFIICDGGKEGDLFKNIIPILISLGFGKGAGLIAPGFSNV